MTVEGGPVRGTPAAIFEVLVAPTGDRAEAESAEAAIYAAATLMREAREQGHASPSASFYADGKLVRSRVRRTDLATALGRCWCGRGSLYGQPGAGWCSHEHAALWRAWDDDLRARTIVARFIYIYGRRTRCRR